MPKNYSNTYLYGKYPEYDKALFSFIMESEKIDVEAKDFSGVLYEVKRRETTPALMKVLKSEVTVLAIAPKPLPRQFKVFCAKDLKGDKKALKVYIDCTDIMHKNKEGNWVCSDVDILISNLLAAMTHVIYYKDENILTKNAQLTSLGARGFSDLMTHVIDYVTKISANPKNQAYCQYMCALYYISNILGRDETTSGMKNIARQISGLSERESDIVDMQLDQNSFSNIKFFAKALSNVLRISKITVDLIVERWMYIYGVSTVFALELFPAFAQMVSDCYIGAYLNNQKTIEKVMGNYMVEFTKNLIRIGADVV